MGRHALSRAAAEEAESSGGADRISSCWRHWWAGEGGGVGPPSPAGWRASPMSAEPTSGGACAQVQGCCCTWLMDAQSGQSQGRIRLSMPTALAAGTSCGGGCVSPGGRGHVQVRGCSSCGDVAAMQAMGREHVHVRVSFGLCARVGEGSGARRTSKARKDLPATANSLIASSTRTKGALVRWCTAASSSFPTWFRNSGSSSASTSPVLQLQRCLARVLYASKEAPSLH